jgi:hypothetical protein
MDHLPLKIFANFSTCHSATTSWVEFVHSEPLLTISGIIMSSMEDMNLDSDILETSAHASGSEHTENELFFILPVLLFLLLAGNIFKYLLAKIPAHYRPPFTIVLFVFGFLVSLVNHYAASTSDFAKGTYRLTNIDPHTILLLLLPPLLFESSSKIDWHTFKRVAGQSLILAGPGVVICTALTAVFVYYVFDYGWNWYEQLQY